MVLGVMSILLSGFDLSVAFLFHCIFTLAIVISGTTDSWINFVGLLLTEIIPSFVTFYTTKLGSSSNIPNDDVELSVKE
jgi:hypothetical protein